MDATIVNAFIEATLFTLETTASVQFQPLDPFLKSDRTARGDISGIIDLAGDVSGTFSVSFESKVILEIVSRMFGEIMTEINDDITDAVGEILNMVAGRTNTKLSEDGKTLKAKFSKVLTDPRHEIAHAPGLPVIAIPIKADSGIITLEICIVE